MSPRRTCSATSPLGRYSRRAAFSDRRMTSRRGSLANSSRASAATAFFDSPATSSGPLADSSTGSGVLVR